MVRYQSFFLHMPINFQYYSTCSNYPLSASMHALRRACHFVNGRVNDALLQCCAKRVVGVVANCCADMMSSDVNGTHK